MFRCEEHVTGGASVALGARLPIPNHASKVQSAKLKQQACPPKVMTPRTSPDMLVTLSARTVGDAGEDE